MRQRRVVITGIGAITPVGHNVAQTWQSLIGGVVGVGKISRFDASGLPVQIAAEIKNYKADDHFDHKEARKLDIYTQFAMIAAREAVADAGLTATAFDPDRTGVITGAGIGGIMTFEEECIKCHTAGPRRISPFFIPKMIGNIAAAHISIEHNFKGINFNVMSACASANHALGTAMRSIIYGDADIVISGGTEAAVTPLAVGGFTSMRALSTRNDDPQTASRPFDKERDGFVMSEGAAILVLEELEHAKARGAKIYAELAGYGASGDAYHITAPTEDGEGSSRAILMAIKDAGLTPEDIDYINAHGTSTPLNDKMESLAIKKVFAERAYQLKISSTKSMTGHLLGAAGAMEAAATVLGIYHHIVHPTINLEEADEDCDLNYVPKKAQKMEIRNAISNSFGFGGHNGSLIFGQFKE